MLCNPCFQIQGQKTKLLPVITQNWPSFSVTGLLDPSETPLVLTSWDWRRCTSKYYLRPPAFPEPGTPPLGSSQLAERLPWAPLRPPVFSDNSLQLGSGSLTSSPCVTDPGPLALSAPLLSAPWRVWALSWEGTLRAKCEFPPRPLRLPFRGMQDTWSLLVGKECLH